MQQTETTEPGLDNVNSTDDLDTRIASAEKQLAKLREAADDADAEAERWRVTFEREPTSESHANQAIYGQRAVNARAALEAFDKEQRQPLIASRNAAIRERENARLLASVAELDAAFAAVRDSLVAAAKALEALPPALWRFESTRQSVRVAVSLEHSSITHRLAEINRDIAEQVPGVRVQFINTGDPGLLRVDIERAAKVPAVLRG